MIVVCTEIIVKKTQKSNKKGLRTAYVSTVIGIVMVLFITGIVAWFVLGINHLKNNKIETFEIDFCDMR